MSRSRQARSAPKPIRAFAYDYPSAYHVRLHRHAHDQLLYASSGVMTVETRDGSWIVPPHRGVWIPARTGHAIRMSGRVSMRTLYVPRALAAIESKRCRILEVTPLLRELVLAAVARGGLDPAVAADANLFAVLCDELRTLPERPIHVPMPRDGRALRLARALLARPEDHRPAAAVAAGAGASPRTLERLFHAETGMTLGTWRRQLRLGRALERLAAGDSVTAVALDSGYDSVSAFISAFRKVFNCTPGRYFAKQQGMLRRSESEKPIAVARPLTPPRTD